MPSPINQNTPLATPFGYYDPEQGVCLSLDNASANLSKPHTTEQPRSVPEGTDAERISDGQDEPNAASRDCFVPVLEAGLACAGSATAVAATTPTGPGVLVSIAIGGAVCGLKVMNAIECLNSYRYPR
jgi:hypothetical protein